VNRALVPLQDSEGNIVWAVRVILVNTDGSFTGAGPASAPMLFPMSDEEVASLNEPVEDERQAAYRRVSVAPGAP